MTSNKSCFKACLSKWQGCVEVWKNTVSDFPFSRLSVHVLPVFCTREYFFHVENLISTLSKRVEV